PRCGETLSDSSGACPCGATLATVVIATTDPLVPDAVTILNAPRAAVSAAGTLPMAATSLATMVLGGQRPTPPGDQGPLRDGQAFGNRYRIIRLLGAGGMGAVYQAWDEELSVALALKVIRVERGSEHAVELERRFKHELLLARQ